MKQQEKQSPAVQAIAGFIVLAVIVGVIYFILNQQSSDSTDAKTENAQSQQTQKENTPKSDKGLFAKYDDIKNGMTKDEVEKLLDEKSDTCGESSAEGVGTAESCTYGDIDDKGLISVIYMNGVVDGKAKAAF